MSYETILLKKENHIATLTMNRPEKMNAVNFQMFDEMLDAIDNVAKDDDIRAFILTGAGKAFCASVDLDIINADGGIKDMGIDELRMFIRRRPQAITLGIRNMEKPTIAMVNGLAVADGVDWIAACDIRIGSEKARFMNAFARMALFPNTGACWQLPRIMGISKALEFLYLGDWISADEALKYDLLNRVVKAEDLEAETMALAARLVQQAPITLRMCKTHVYKGLNMSFEEYLELAADGEAMTTFTQDAKEALLAFKEKRTPNFVGK